MFLLGLFILALIPKDSFQPFNLEMAARRVEQDLHYAHERAAITNINHGVQFTANGNYFIYQSSTTNPALDPLKLEASNVNISQIFKGAQILNNAQFEFDPLGRPVIGSGQTVQLGSGGNTITLMITPNTGVVQRQ